MTVPDRHRHGDPPSVISNASYGAASATVKSKPIEASVVCPPKFRPDETISPVSAFAITK